MTTHTPGPWSRNIPPARKYCVIFAGRNTHVAQVATQGLSDEEIEANCDLIRTAPEMLAALRLSHRNVNSLIDMHPVGGDAVDLKALNTWADELRAAIAKAEGRGT